MAGSTSTASQPKDSEDDGSMDLNKPTFIAQSTTTTQVTTKNKRDTKVIIVLDSDDEEDQKERQITLYFPTNMKGMLSVDFADSKLAEKTKKLDVSIKYK